MHKKYYLQKSRLFDKIVVFAQYEIAKDLKQEYNLTDEMYQKLYENGELAFYLKFMYPQNIINMECDIG